ncbi:psbP domain-containing protein 5 [Pyrus ussuriensis x Pyrus communis]|uniref:PsbP domain-containing protein 5 n=1 Tax=Pyrus ussuriensis x Pyrus communis TaxID=2448454 RepID=A0A5N5HNK6_9ROSA|nr:psbP domain-containing protein 5 [Pyrus ussuriensis x Pyrus communis]
MVIYREQSRIVMQQLNNWQISSSGNSKPKLLLFGISAPVLLVLPASGSLAEEDLKMASFVDDINSYSYLYPTELPSKKALFKRVESRKPERYSSAAPLSPDARLRIVSERVDIVDNLIISILSTWTAKDVADSVFADKSALRVTSTQRQAESQVLDAHTGEIDGQPYWYHEYLVHKAPTKTADESTNYRHYVASTTERDGYLYSINASTLNKQWNIVGPILQKTVASFHLLPPTENYVPPFKDPWRFW